MSRKSSRRDSSHEAEHVKIKLEQNTTSRSAPCLKGPARMPKAKNSHRTSVPATFSSPPIMLQSRFQSQQPIISFTQSQNQPPIQGQASFEQHKESIPGFQQSGASNFAGSVSLDSNQARQYADSNLRYQQHHPQSQVQPQSHFRPPFIWPPGSIPQPLTSTQTVPDQRYFKSRQLPKLGLLNYDSPWDRDKRALTPVQNPEMPGFLQNNLRDLDRFVNGKSAHIRTQSMEQFEQLSYGGPAEAFESPPESQELYHHETTQARPLEYSGARSASPQFGGDIRPSIDNHLSGPSTMVQTTLQLPHPAAQHQVQSEARLQVHDHFPQNVQMQYQTQPPSRSPQHQHFTNPQSTRTTVPRCAIPQQSSGYYTLDPKQQLAYGNSGPLPSGTPPLIQIQPLGLPSSGHRPVPMASPPLDSQTFSDDQLYAPAPNVNTLTASGPMQPIDLYSGYTDERLMPNNPYQYGPGASFPDSGQQPISLVQAPVSAPQGSNLKVDSDAGPSPLLIESVSDQYAQYASGPGYNSDLLKSEEDPLVNLESQYQSEARTQWLKEDEDELMALLQSGEKFKWRYVSDSLIFSERCRVPANACLARFKALYGEHETESELRSSLFYVAHPQGWAALANLTPKPDRNSTVRL